ncbi:MAG: 5-formyltetrahydrofolate cyclo-ligase [Chitinophagaceae bacterium]
MDKKTVRQYFREKRKSLSKAERLKLDDLILIQFQQLVLPPLQTIFSYHPLELHHEPETAFCVRFLEFRHPGLQIAYPRTNTTSWTMEAILTGPDTEFELASFNLPEPVGGEIVNPENIDLVLVPMLACDREGYRAGFGKGVYDRFLARCRPDCIKVGLSYFEPIEKIEDRDEFDVPLNFSVTPGTIYVF